MSAARAPRLVPGIGLQLRLIRPGDAEYVHALRSDPTYGTHLSTVTGGVEDQRRWIERYRQREAEGTEAYYVIERRHDGARCGLVRLYDIAGDHFTWGSWILDAGKTPKAALESAVLSMGVGFEALDKSRAVLDVRRANRHAAAFYRRFGMQAAGEDAQNFYFEYRRSRYEADRAGHLVVVAAANPRAGAAPAWTSTPPDAPDNAPGAQESKP